MVQLLKVMLWGEEIGRLAWDSRRRLAYFVYHPAFLKKGLDIAPLTAPVDGVRGRMPIWGEEGKIYQGCRHSWPTRCLTLGEINCLTCGVNRITCPIPTLLRLTSCPL